MQFAFLIVFILFYGRDWQGGVFKFMKNDHFVSIFSRFGLFLQVFGQVNEWPISELHEMKRVSHAVACAIDFFLCYLMIEVGREECSKL